MKCDHNGIVSCGQYNCNFCFSRSFLSLNSIKVSLWNQKRNFCKPINCFLDTDRIIYLKCMICEQDIEMTPKEASENEIKCLNCTRKELYKKNKEIKIMSNKKPLRCEVCDKSFNYEYQLKNHKNSIAHISKVEGSRYKCSKCDFETDIKGNYRSHCLNNHCTKEERKKGFPFYCEKCDVGSMTQKGLDKHFKTKAHNLK
jgi:hypothetical protein